MEVEPAVTLFEKIEFCQTQPLWAGDRYTMVRNPRVTFTKDSISIERLENTHAWCQHWLAVADGGLALTDGVPLVSNYYHSLRRSALSHLPKNYDPGKRYKGRDLSDTGFGMMAAGLTFQNRGITDESRLSFARAFDIDPDYQIELEILMNKTHISPKEVCPSEGMERFPL